MNLWYPAAKLRLGPAGKRLSGRNPAHGVVCHSAVGYVGGLHSVLDTLTGPKARTAWHFSVLQDGTVEQHYPLDAVLGHCADWGGDADGVDGNGTLIGIEHEGGYSPTNEPLTLKQLAASVELVRWIARQGGWIPARAGVKTLYEHREISDTGTQCPSGRIPWEEYLVLPRATTFDWAQFYTNGARPVRVQRRNSTTLEYVYEVVKRVKG